MSDDERPSFKNYDYNTPPPKFIGARYLYRLYKHRFLRLFGFGKTRDQLEEELNPGEYFLLFAKDVQASDDRSHAIITISILEDILTSTLKNRLILNSDMRDKLFSGYGPLSSLAVKIDLGYAVGLYSKDVHHDLHVLRRVRNKFAHDWNPKLYHHSEISDALQTMSTLKVNGLVDSAPRSKLNNTAWLFIFMLSNIHDLKIKPVREDERLSARAAAIPFL